MFSLNELLMSLRKKLCKVGKFSPKKMKEKQNQSHIHFKKTLSLGAFILTLEIIA